MRFGIIGSGSWATALAKILTDNKHSIRWCVRNEDIVRHIQHRHHNPNYLSSVYFDTALLNLSTDAGEVINNSDCVLMAVPSAYIINAIAGIDKASLKGKK